jgi:alkanesulfonate monooxygenase SsuD/methylene tetrahydromethanopterin reductase-like flavin-dependent oxidoreductase (luciferase family)
MQIRARQKDRTETNPALSSRRLKLGTFQTNLDSGCVMSDLDGRLDITWPNTVALAKLAEEMEFEALVPVARWQGWGGKTNPQGPGFEAYTWAAGIAASTRTPGVFSTSHITINHPIVAAKQSAAIDHISGGRFTLNIVTGWVQPEIEMFGQPMLSHEDRYACAEEWITIIRRLWTEDDSFDYEGRFFRIAKGYLAPKPIQYPHPAIMNAGASELGRHFAVKHCDLVFTVIRTGGLDECRAHVEAYHKLARETYGRHIRVWTLVNIVQRETEKEARDFYDYYVGQKGDWEAAANMVATFSLEVNRRNVTPERIRPLQEAFIQGWGGLPVVGTKEQVVDTLVTLSRAGLDGVLVAFPRYEQGLREFRDVTYPLLRQAGLRDFA